MKHIIGVVYRRPLLRAYIKVAGKTERAARKVVEKLTLVLRRVLPNATIVDTRSKGLDLKTGHYVLEVPVIIVNCENKARAVIARMVLQGEPVRKRVIVQKVSPRKVRPRLEADPSVFLVGGYSDAGSTYPKRKG